MAMLLHGVAFVVLREERECGRDDGRDSPCVHL